MKILVTGGAGFIGSHLCRRLINAGHEVLCLDNLYTGAKRNIADLLGHPQFNLVIHDVMQPFWCAVDQIYHLACPASPVHYQKNPVETLKTSFLGTMHMLDLALKTKARILFSSTSEVYGDPHISPQDESYRGNVNVVGVRSCYDEGKRAAETLMMDYHREYGVDIRIIRIFNTYGPAMHPQDGRVVSNLIMQALQNQTLTIYGDGTQTRSFQYIDDLLEGMVRMMDNTSGCIGPINIGSDQEFTIQSIAEKIRTLIPQSTSTITYVPLPQDDPKQRRADNSLAKKVLDRSPTVSLETGLQKTIAYFASLIS